MEQQRSWEDSKNRGIISSPDLRSAVTQLSKIFVMLWSFTIPLGMVKKGSLSTIFVMLKSGK